MFPRELHDTNALIVYEVCFNNLFFSTRHENLGG